MAHKKSGANALFPALLAGIAYLPFGVIFALTKKYSRPPRRRRHR